MIGYFPGDGKENSYFCTNHEEGAEFGQDGDARYAGIDAPRTECLKDVVARLLPYWESAIVPDLRAGRTVLVAAHGNSLRALVKHLDGISDTEIAGPNIPTGIPLRYDLTEDLRPVTPGGTYLDPDAAREAAAAIPFCAVGLKPSIPRLNRS